MALGLVQRACSVRGRVCTYPFRLWAFSLWMAPSIRRLTYISAVSTWNAASIDQYEQQWLFEWVRNLGLQLKYISGRNG